MTRPSLPLSAALALAACTPALSQEAAADDAPSLRPIVVTPAPGREATAFDTPASVDVVGREAIGGPRLQVNLSEPLVRVAGVVALNRQNYAQDLQVSIRGFGARSTFGVRGLRLYVDGIPATAPDGQSQVSHFDLASADRIEVLRGPFSVLHGNASGGVISLFTADGGPGRTLDAATAFGSDGVRRHNLRLGGTDGPWNWNASATRFSTDGWRGHGVAERTGFNGKLRYTAASGTRLTLVANGVDMPGVQDPLGLTRAEWQAAPRQASPAALQFNTRKSVDQLQAGAVLEHRLDDVHSFKASAWRGRRGTEQFQAIPVAAQAAPTHAGGVIDLARDAQGLDLQWVARQRTERGQFTFTAGYLRDELEERRRGFRNFVGTQEGVRGPLRRDEVNQVRSSDPYLQAHWAGERLSLTAGLRQSTVRFTSRDRFFAPGNGDDSGSTRFRALTPALGAVFHVHERLNLYAAAGGGFETPTLNELSYRPGGEPGLNLDLGSARSRQWELGVKAEPAPGWRLEAALFQARTRGEIVVLGNSGGRSTFQNAGATRRRGVEATLAGQWGEGWSLLASAAWLQAQFTEDFLACGPAPCLAPSVGVAAGNRLPGVPRLTAFAELGWKHKPWGLETALEWRHIGAMAADDRNTEFAPAATVWNARIGFSQRMGAWTVREFLRIDNLANHRYAGSVIVNEGNRRFFESAPGRQWLAGVSAAYAF